MNFSIPRVITKRPYVLIITSILLFHSCAQLKELSKVSKPRVSVSEMNITGLSLNSIELTADIEIANPNNIALDLSSYNYTFKINELTFLSGLENQNTIINANESSTIKIPLQINYSELVQTIQSLRNEPESAFEFEASFGFNVPVIGDIEIPVRHSGKIPLLKRPSISLQNFSVDDISLSGADLSIQLQIENPNTVQFDMNRLSYDFKINGMSSISGLMEETINLASNTVQTVNIPLSISFLNVGMNAYRILSGNGDIEYTLEGSTTLGSNLPYFELSTFDFDKSGSINIDR